MLGVAGRIANSKPNLVGNGDMRIDQRNAGAAVVITNSAKFCPDRFNNYCQNPVGNTATAQQVLANGPASFPYLYALKYLSTNGAALAHDMYAFIQTSIEGVDFQNAFFGTANAKPLILRFSVFATIVGNYGLVFRNGANASRFYTTTYTVNQANTWEEKFIVIPGDVGGAWAVDNSNAFALFWDMGTGGDYSVAATNAWTTTASVFGVTGVVKPCLTTNAFVMLTGVKLEIGNTPTPFIIDPYAISLERSQRYYVPFSRTNSQMYGFVAMAQSATHAWLPIIFPTTMRVSPTVAVVGTHQLVPAGAGIPITSIVGHTGYPESYLLDVITAGGITLGQAIELQATATPSALQFSAEM